MKYILHVFFIILIALVTFFGLGPVLFADGTARERVLTSIVLVLIYALLGFGYWMSIKLIKRK
ncbi:hypothetical protein PH210_18690 [Paenibacillus sp. BSR1-1]|uniref:DUF6954 family protein n=1 Tax=Paenibacillus sp. BSR1-1 TaxID=3020845 RepID=UPI0025AFDAF6|nr:hypothetical protein [Paenibacillus sp. BSR1-1]MDN3018209.1 hypothetical protein [Paenibacillus sp. BSR1-1]